MHPWSHSCPTEMRHVLIPGNMCTLLAAGGKCCILSDASWVLVSACPFDTVTSTGFSVGLRSNTGVFVVRGQKWPVVPESTTGCSSTLLIKFTVGGEGTLELFAPFLNLLLLQLFIWFW